VSDQLVPVNTVAYAFTSYFIAKKLAQQIVTFVIKNNLNNNNGNTKYRTIFVVSYARVH